MNINLFAPLQKTIDHIEIHHRWLAQLIDRVIPSACPFACDLRLFGHVVHVPPLCKLNPIYEQLVALRYRAIEFLNLHS